MPLTNQTLFDIRGRVRQFRRGVDESQVDAWVNDRIRQALNYRTYWSSLIQKGTISIPDAYTTGTVSTATGSPLVHGVGCNFPVSDVVNATIPAGVVEYGYQSAYPNNMNGITYESILLVDGPLGYGGGAEAVPVVAVVANNNGFDGQFRALHAAGCHVTQSSLAGRQFRIGLGTPIFTVLAVLDAETLLLDQNWSGPPLTDKAYQILKIYFTFGANVQELFWVLDQAFGLPLSLNTSVRSANRFDPQRINAGPTPTNIVDAHPSPGGLTQWEIWPHMDRAYSLQYAAYQNWPALVNDTDRPPWFFSPTLWYHGALADSLRFRAGVTDFYHNPRLADTYEQKFMLELQQEANADEAKCLRELSSGSGRVAWPGGANFEMRSDFDAWTGNY